ncbi:aspartate-semialdehyde dehydrogenase [bacterium]|nr:aspartate-semialdehyde dehydrogenase [bacterium]
MRLAIIGASGLVGGEYLRIIAAQRSGVTEVIPVASSRSAGSSLELGGMELTVRDLAQFDFADCDYALFCVGDDLSREYVPQALAAGCHVVDKSNAYRMDPQVPLVVGGANDGDITPQTKLVANPNCSTIILVHGIKSLAQFGIRRIWVATYQSMSGAGRAGIDKLVNEIDEYGLDPQSGRADCPEDAIAYNVVPGIGGMDSELRCSEERKLLQETRKILSMPDLAVVPHAVRVPVSVGHSMAVSVEFDTAVSAEAIEEAWSRDSDVLYRRDSLPSPLAASRHDMVEAGRLRAEDGIGNGWSFFLSGDNINLGAALNGWRLLSLIRAHHQNLEAKAG